MSLNRKKRYIELVMKIYEDDFNLAYKVARMGEPVFTEDLPTAAVGYNDTSGKVVYYFNPEFFDKLTDNEAKFVILHESMHLIFLHVFSGVKYKKNIKDETELALFDRFSNIAMDCVVNDSLRYYFKLDYVDENSANLGIDDKTQLPKLIWGENIVSKRCYNLTWQQVYRMILENDDYKKAAEQYEHLEQHIWDTFFDKNGELKEGAADKIKKAIKGCAKNPNATDSERALSEKLLKKLKIQGLLAGDERKKIDLKNSNLVYSNKKIVWNKILGDFVNVKNMQDTWSKLNKKLSSVYPRVILPAEKIAEKERIVAFIDVSGSINMDAYKTFMSVLRNHPKHIVVDAVAFNTDCQPFDLHSEEPDLGGGTSFYILEEYINENYTKYPNGIFVLTDGHGDEINPKIKSRWCWLLYGNDESLGNHFCADMKHYDIFKLLR